ncbi:TPA: hypothetical protein ACGAEJ_003043 [Legionella pneumophila]
MLYRWMLCEANTQDIGRTRLVTLQVITLLAQYRATHDIPLQGSAIHVERQCATSFSRKIAGCALTYPCNEFHHQGFGFRGLILYSVNNLRTTPLSYGDVGRCLWYKRP